MLGIISAIYLICICCIKLMSLQLYLEVLSRVRFFFFLPCDKILTSLYNYSCLLSISSLFSFADTVVFLKADRLFTSTLMIYLSIFTYIVMPYIWHSLQAFTLMEKMGSSTLVLKKIDLGFETIDCRS